MSVGVNISKYNSNTSSYWQPQREEILTVEESRSKRRQRGETEKALLGTTHMFQSRTSTNRINRPKDWHPPLAQPRSTEQDNARVDNTTKPKRQNQSWAVGSEKPKQYHTITSHMHQAQTTLKEEFISHHPSINKRIESRNTKEKSNLPQRSYCLIWEK